MLKLIGRFVVFAGALFVIATYVPGIHVDSTETVFIVAIVWSLIIMFVRPVLKILTFPLTLITLGLFSFVLNATLFGVVAWFVPGFDVDGFLPAFLGSILLSLVTFVVDSLFTRD